jgi:hypothetical protein
MLGDWSSVIAPAIDVLALPASTAYTGTVTDDSAASVNEDVLR